MRDHSPGLFDWRIFAGVAVIHGVLTLSYSLDWSWWRQEKPLMITIELSELGTLSGADRSQAGASAVPPNSVVKKVEKKVVDTPKPQVPIKPNQETLPAERSESGSQVLDPSTSASASQSASASAPSAVAGGLAGVSQARVDVNARVLSNPKPIYPAKAYADRIEGTVLVRAQVTETGKTEGVRVVKSSGDSSLDLSALEAVKRWQFSPARHQGKIVAQVVQIPIKFTLSQEER